jgi:hypothetical protein
MHRRRLVEHWGDDLLETNGTESQTPCKGQILFLPTIILVIVMRMTRSAFSGLEYFTVLPITRNFVILVVRLRAFSMTIIRGRRTSCSVGHSKFSTSLGKSGPTMDPKHMIYYESAGRLLSRGNGV